ncbi:MAG: hypothetical protein KIS85_06065 [Anaerolineales bacterium]|nr:hypothetical protein [Anaerolineales bacterium]
MNAKRSKTSLSTTVHPDLGTLRAKVERRREYLDLLEIELSNTRRAIHEFTQVYNRRVAPLQKQQARLRQMLDELLADQAPPPSGWQANRLGRGGTAAAGEPVDEGEERLPAKKQAAPKDPDYERKLRELFRQLAKRYHPDLAASEAEKKEHEEVMAQINQAYMNKDLETLQALDKSHPAGATTPSQASEAQLARLTLELRQLDTMIFEVENTIRELDLSPAMQMHSESKADRSGRRDPIAEMESDVRARISELEEQLLGLGVELEGPAGNQRPK